MESNSQSFQDLFALQVCTKKTYIEIGANRPIKRNNTYLLENNEYTGYSIEFNTKWQRFWNKTQRKNKIYFADAITFDYLQANQENNLTNKIGYLSCDIEPVTNTFSALKRVINQGIEFECITFEHDIYQSDIDLRENVNSFLSNNGYKIAVNNVYLYPDSDKIFETWYVHSSIEFKECNFSDWIKTIDIH